MKKFLFAILVLAASVVNAAEVQVLKADLFIVNEFNALVDARFYMNTKTGEGFVKASVTEERYTGYPFPDCIPDQHGRCVPSSHRPQPTMETVLSKTAKIEGLMLMGDQAVYQAPEGNVVCGTMGTSRIFKIPTLYLSGNCKLEADIVREGVNKKLIVTLKTK